MAARFDASYEGIGDMLCATWMQAAMRARAKTVLEAAEALAPERSGHYKSSFVLSSGVREGKTRRAYGRVSNTARYAIDIEFGSARIRRHRVLGKALGIA